ncbi:hypothetical protein MD484_g712, partial [Candolleomyces efflorescens]
MTPTVAQRKPVNLVAQTASGLGRLQTRARRKGSKVAGVIKGVVKRMRTRAGSILLCGTVGITFYECETSAPQANEAHEAPICPPKVISETPSTISLVSVVTTNNNLDLPIHNLPPELLTEVFAIACFSEVAATNTARRERTTPLVLGQICRHWRDIVLSTPHLWSWVLIRLYRSKYDSQLEILKNWIGHTSSNQPLTIELSFEDEDAWVSKPPHELLQILLKESHRWRSIDLTLPEACYQRIKAAKSQFPILEKIALQPLLADAHVSQAERKRLDVFEGVVPELTHLRLNGYYLDDCSLPWDQLQDLVLQHVYVDECFYALNRAQNLVRCTLSTMLVNDCNRPVKKIQLTMPHLKRLRIQGASGTDQATLLAHLTAPSLLELIISSTDASLAFADVVKMVARSDCILRTFEVNGFDLDEAALVEMLNGLPTVEGLHIVPNPNGSLANGLLDALRDSQPSTSTTTTSNSSSSSSLLSAPVPTSFLPNLQCLEYEGDVAFEEETLMRMIRSRTGSGSECGQMEGSEDGMSSSGGLVRKLEVVKLSVNKSFSSDCQTLLSSLGG